MPECFWQYSGIRADAFCLCFWRILSADRRFHAASEYLTLSWLPPGI